jgi:hypothetical protein
MTGELQMKSMRDVESFGAVDADADRLLEKCFEDHEAYLDARSHKKFIVIGRKCSGKTAIRSSSGKSGSTPFHSVTISVTTLGTFMTNRQPLEFQRKNASFRVGAT